MSVRAVHWMQQMQPQAFYGTPSYALYLAESANREGIDPKEFGLKRQIQLGIQADLLVVNARIHLNVLEAWRQHQPQAKLISTGSSCVYPELDRPISEADFQAGPMHPSVRGYGLAKQMLAVGTVHGNADCVWFQASFNFATAACMRLFTVPTGMFRASAASRYFISWK